MDTVEFNLGELVYLKVKADEAAMVTGITFRPSGVRYLITWGNACETGHYGIELTKERSFKVLEN